MLTDPPLHEVTFVVVDLETTGGAPGASTITEVGAVKVRGGEVLGEFQTLVAAAEPVPAEITALTGISDSALAGAPPLPPVLASFLEFRAGAVLVAHNAPYDLGFLRAACAELDRYWPECDVVDTVLLARRLVDREEAPDCKLATLARLFRTATAPFFLRTANTGNYIQYTSI
jgi:DNA polymerase-3 subunit epsilon